MSTQVDTDTTERLARNDDDYVYAWQGTTNYRYKLTVLLGYTPANAGDWGSPTPDFIPDAVDELVSRVAALEGSGGSVDASAVTYTPQTPADWAGSMDPGNVDSALDQLADRTADLENSSLVSSTGTSTDNAIARFHDTSGTEIQNSTVKIDDNGEIYDYRAKRKVISGTTGSIDSADSGWLVEATNGSAVAIEFDNGIPVDACGTILQSGAGQITFSVESGGTLRNRSSHTKSAGQYALISWVCKSNSGGSAAEIVIGGDTTS